MEENNFRWLASPLFSTIDEAGAWHGNWNFKMVFSEE